MDIVTRFKNEKDALEYIKECERRFGVRMNECLNELVRGENRFIMLGGPTCSGKTTAAGTIVDAMRALGHEIEIVSVDDFFFDRSELNKRASLDYDSIDAIDMQTLYSVVEKLRCGRESDLPIFDFKSGKRVGQRTIEMKKEKVVLFEGIQTLYPEVVSLFDKNETKSIYISVGDDVCFDGVTVDARTIRLMRRIVRDHARRSSSVEFTLKLWESVCENEERSILPYADRCDLFIDSLLGYELSALKAPLLRLLSDLCRESKYYPETTNLLELLSGVDEIGKTLIPDGSLMNEFI